MLKIPEVVDVTDSWWKNLELSDRKKVMRHFERFGVTPHRTRRVETHGDQLTVTEYHYVDLPDGAMGPHLHADCPECEHEPMQRTCGEFGPDDLCLIVRTL